MRNGGVEENERSIAKLSPQKVGDQEMNQLRGKQNKKHRKIIIWSRK